MHDQLTVLINGATYAPLPVVDKIARVIRCGLLGRRGYPGESEAAAEDKIDARRVEFRKLLANMPTRPAASRIVEVDDTVDEAPIPSPNHACVPEDHDVDDDNVNAQPSALVRFWTDVSTIPTVDFETAVEGYFRHPHIAAIYAQIDTNEEALRDNDHIETIDAYSEGRPPSGFVYAAWNPLFAGLIKIGATMRTPQIRLRELSGAGVPEPFELVASIPSTNPFKLEREIHRRFDDVRKYGRKKEFFILTRDEAKAYFASVAAHGMSIPERCSA